MSSMRRPVCVSDNSYGVPFPSLGIFAHDRRLWFRTIGAFFCRRGVRKELQSPSGRAGHQPLMRGQTAIRLSSGPSTTWYQSYMAEVMQA